MNSEIISLEPLYKFVRHCSGVEAFDGRSKLGREYARLVSQRVQAIDTSRGFYLWGAYNHRGFWRNIYLGQAGFGKTAHLRERIRKELSAERCSLWRLVLSETELMAIRAKHYGPRYADNWRRAFQKAGATYIVWVADPELSNRDVHNVVSSPCPN